MTPSAAPRDDELAELTAQNVELRARLARSAEQLAALDDRLRAATRELDVYRTELRDMRRSRLWRLGAPVREARERMLGIRTR